MNEEIKKLNEEKVEEFLEVKNLEGCSVSTIKNYRWHLINMLKVIDKNVSDVTTVDLRKFLNDYKEIRQVSNVTLSNMRSIFRSFFSWMYNEDYITKDPSLALNKIKIVQSIKEPFSEEELELLRENAKTIRDQALIEVLYSSGMRVSELRALNRNDIDWVNKSCIVFGKGGKEREVYFSTKAIMLLKRYLESRVDTNESLFVKCKAPYDRLTVDGIEYILSTIGNRCGVKCHPHRFRHTCATYLLNKGMPVQEVSKVLGHARLETTMRYCKVDQISVKTNHRKYIN